jgi:aspartate/tyrosine/aromatic aminotransferase
VVAFLLLFLQLIFSLMLSGLSSALSCNNSNFCSLFLRERLWISEPAWVAVRSIFHVQGVVRETAGACQYHQWRFFVGIVFF